MDRMSFKRRARSRALGLSILESLPPSLTSLLPLRETTPGAFTAGAQLLNAFTGGGTPLNDTTKDEIVEGPGRRVYDDLTAIDWIFEYTKERLRIRTLERQGGLTSQLKLLFDSSQIWLVLIGTGNWSHWQR